MLNIRTAFPDGKRSFSLDLNTPISSHRLKVVIENSASKILHTASTDPRVWTAPYTDAKTSSSANLVINSLFWASSGMRDFLKSASKGVADPSKIFVSFEPDHAHLRVFLFQRCPDHEDDFGPLKVFFSEKAHQKSLLLRQAGLGLLLEVLDQEGNHVEGHPKGPFLLVPDDINPSPALSAVGSVVSSW